MRRCGNWLSNCGCDLMGGGREGEVVGGVGRTHSTHAQSWHPPVPLWVVVCCGVMSDDKHHRGSEADVA